MRENEVDRIVFSSTCATYGVPETIPIHEDTSQEPINPYGASKLMVERMIQDFGIAHGLKGIALRYFNAAGADLDKRSVKPTIPRRTDPAGARCGLRTADQRDGVRHRLRDPDGTCIRDYIHVTDLADAHVKAIEALERGAASKPTILASDKASPCARSLRPRRK